MTAGSSELGPLTVRYLPASGDLEVGCTVSGDTALISAVDMEGMLTEIRKFVSAHPCCDYGAGPSSRPWRVQSNE